ncbi:NAD(P)/FAD-dependent oxidoreductase [Halioxenophilus aromaticivorans]|uniref:FAD-binding oxidoreductase n=1 Tax=Halioxenophilus aromaticivorans TaxID=1306992 RepID=A0AAV3TZI7_9ALTE
MQKADVAIVGAGIIGCACAYYLARAGLSVVVIDRDQINSGASGRNAGSLHFQLEYRLIQNQEALHTQLPHLIPLTLAAIEQWKSLDKELGADIGLGMSGGMMLAETSQQVSILERKAEVENKYGLAVTLLDKNQTLAKAPYLSDSINAALFCEFEGHCNPRLLTPAFSRAAAELGVDFSVESLVQRVDRRSGKWHLQVQKENTTSTVVVEHVVNAAGAWAHEFGLKANVHLPIFPVPLMMSVTESTPKFLNYLIQHVGQKLSLKQVADGNVLIGGGWSSRLKGDGIAKTVAREADIELSQLKANLRVASNTIPALKKLNLLRTWTGITGVTADQLPLVGGIKAAPGMHVAAGGSGFTYGPIYAKLLSESILTGREPELIAPYSPNRFSHINMFMGA